MSETYKSILADSELINFSWRVAICWLGSSKLDCHPICKNLLDVAAVKNLWHGRRRRHRQNVRYRDVAIDGSPQSATALRQSAGGRTRRGMRAHTRHLLVQRATTSSQRSSIYHDARDTWRPRRPGDHSRYSLRCRSPSQPRGALGMAASSRPPHLQ